MTIKLINPPQPNSLDDRLDPPLGLMYISAMLKNNGFEPEIIDLPFHSKEEWEEVIGKADIIGITIFSSSLYLAKEIAKIAKKNNPHCLVVVGGPHVAALPDQTLEECHFDIAARNEGEMVMLDIVQKKPLEEIMGIVYRKKGEIIHNPSRPLIEDLDILPFPDRSVLKKYQYTRKLEGRPLTSMTTSRGCPYRCAFCFKEIFGQKARLRSVQNVLDEIKELKEEYGINDIIFYDDILTLNKERFHNLCDGIKKHNITFRCNGNSRIDDYPVFKKLYESGCREICFGIESGSQKILDNINKLNTVERNIQAVKEARKAGLIVKAFLMIGNPGETRKTIEETKKFILEADPDQFTLFTFVPLPGCDIWKDPEKYKIKIITKDFRNYFNIAGENEGGLTIETEELTAEDIKNLRKELVDFLENRGQRGGVQDYYKKISKTRNL